MTSNDLHGIEFTVTSREYKPFEYKVINPTTGHIRWKGICFELLDALAESLNFSYRVVEPPDGKWGGHFDNGSWQGMLGMIERKEVDFAVGPFTITKERSDAFAFMHSFWAEPASFVVRMPTRISMARCFWPLQAHVWLVMIASLFASAMVYWAITEAVARLENAHGTTKRSSYNDILFSILMSTCLQGWDSPPQHGSQRLFLGSFWFSAIVIAFVYSGNLVALLTVYKPFQPVDSLQDLVDNPDYDVGLIKGTALESLFKGSNVSLYQTLWDRVKAKEATSLASAKEDLLPRLSEGNFAYINELSYMQTVAEMDCKYHLSTERFFSSWFAFPTHKDFKYKDIFDERILRLFDSGLIEKWKRQYIHRQNGCEEEVISTHAQSVQLGSVIGGFILLAVGIGSAFITLLLELAISG